MSQINQESGTHQYTAEGNDWSGAAQAFQSAGDPNRAKDCFLNAARSFTNELHNSVFNMQNNIPLAMQSIESAISAYKSAGDQNSANTCQNILALLSSMGTLEPGTPQYIGNLDQIESNYTSEWPAPQNIPIPHN